MSHNSSTASDIELFSTAPESQRPGVKGKFIYIDGEKFYIRGVTYGPFHPNASGSEYHDPEEVERDLRQMISNNINTIRTYTVPPRWLLDLALKFDMRVMVDLPGTHHTSFLDDRKHLERIEEKVVEGVRNCSFHPAILCYSIGNEIPGPIVRWHGPKVVEKYLERLYEIVKKEDPDALVTYVNFPTTEYLQLPFLDIFCFNIYLESEDLLRRYLARLHNLADNKPVILAEIGLDSRRNGEEKQASSIDWQIHTAFTSGCAGIFVFSWTDEWHREGYDIDDWDFGLTTRSRQPKPALASTRRAYAEVPFGNMVNWPKISVVVCTYNGHNSIGECLEGLSGLEYPEYEVIIVNDGSTQETADVINYFSRKYGFKAITTDNRGLSSARNTGLEAASGEIVAYIDDDAFPDPDWLNYIALSFTSTTHVGIGGPNIAPGDDGLKPACIDHVPGNPSHVLISDEEAEHIPGCNMAFRRHALLEAGGFDPHFRIAGDDVDICWRLRKKGWTLGFSPSAVVWHHRRSSLLSYWKQQVNYGRAEALLEKKWPEKYNETGNCDWAGRIYGNGLSKSVGLISRKIYQGVWGSAPFQSIYLPAPSKLQSLILIPEWYLIILLLFSISCIGFFWKPLLFVLPLFVMALGASVVNSILSSTSVNFQNGSRSRYEITKMRLLTAFLYMIQPLARLFGRLSLGLTPWRRHGLQEISFPRPRTHSIWRETWQPHEKILEAIENSLRDKGAVVIRGGNFDSWDLEVRGGLFGAMRTRVAVEEHGAGKQMIRLKSWPRVSRLGFVLTLFFSVLAILASMDQAWYVYIILGVTAAITAVRCFGDCAVATNSYLRVIKEQKSDNS
jgi:cellulose synthase/poly-beta-1,6-N-acetylglucosamine synthase-like glycosyltransferase